MKIVLRRFLSDSEATMGILLVDGKPTCWTLEDQKQAKKVMAETRIPEGEYIIKLRKEGGHHEKYGKKFPKIHKGMLELQNVPGFQWILIHIGNNDDDSAGCILVGDDPGPLSAGLTIEYSTACYEKLYKLIIAAINQNELVTIKIEDIE